MITLGTASAFPADFGITRNVEAARTSAAILRARPHRAKRKSCARSNPIFYGYTEKRTARALGQRSSVDRSLAGRESEDPDALPGRRSSVLSGLMKGANEIRSRPAILDVPVGQRQVVMFATNPMLSLAEFRRIQHAVQRHHALQQPEVAAGHQSIPRTILRAVSASYHFRGAPENFRPRYSTHRAVDAFIGHQPTERRLPWHFRGDVPG